MLHGMNWAEPICTPARRIVIPRNRNTRVALDFSVNRCNPIEYDLESSLSNLGINEHSDHGSDNDLFAPQKQSGGGHLESAVVSSSLRASCVEISSLSELLDYTLFIACR